MDATRITLYLLAIVTSSGCAVLLLRSYLRKHMRLLFWSGLCFLGLTVNNIFLFLDLVVFTETDLRPVRLISALIGMLFLLYGFIWDSD